MKIMRKCSYKNDAINDDIEKIDNLVKLQEIVMQEDAMDAYIRQAERVHKKRVRLIKALKYFGTVLVFVVLLLVKSMESSAQSRKIYEQVIRFHVLANSDSKEDQELKLKVKNKVVTYMQTLLQDCRSKEEAEKILSQYMEQLITLSKQVIEEEGYDYSVTAKLEQHYFPVKTYGNQVYPEGEYEALRILIGKAEGKNWWCVMFPSLCMLNDTYSVVPEETALPEPEQTPTPEPEEEMDVEYHFFILDWLKDLF